tara:strand:+ start:3827 stop:4498 length:672 start_codon:yes stop_codon:yes gene_type:complete
MVEERNLLKSNRHVFWEALIVTIFIFGIGMMLGISLENRRSATIAELYIESELNLLDLKIQADILNLGILNCEAAEKENIKFGDRIFEEARLLQKLEESQTLTDSLKQQHKKYDLLRTLFWVNSIKIKKQCNSTFHTIVYIYDYATILLEQKARQSAFSKYISELKQEKGDKVILIPIAGNMDLLSTESLMLEYEIEKLPVIIIDESEKIYEIEQLSEINALV